MSKYNPSEIEKKWQEKWAADQVYVHKDQPEKEKYYMLDMFPYPSGDGLHMGHTESYTASDIIYRYKRHKGYDVLHPQGFDSFGLPAENYAIKTGVHPAETTEENAATYIEQMKMLGLGHDLGNMVYTSRPDYYKWTQFLFGKFFEGGLLERKTDTINWCPSCNTGIANEQVEDGKCERCKTDIEQRQIPSWNMKITDFADELADDLDKVDWPEHTKKNQRNWIGRSYGASLIFEVKSEKGSDKTELKVFTTRPDTLFGATYMVIAPEHSLITQNISHITNQDEVMSYVEKAKNKTEMERQENKEKTGVEIKGVKAINPATKEEIPIFVADYVLFGYGTGAIMAVPAHDERDYEFAKKYGLEIRQVVAPDLDKYNSTIKTLNVLNDLYQKTEKNKVKFWLLGGLSLTFYKGFVWRDHDDLDLMVKSKEDYEKLIKILEKDGFKKIEEKEVKEDLISSVYKNDIGVEVDLGYYGERKNINDEDFGDKVYELEGVKTRLLSLDFVKKIKEWQVGERGLEKDTEDWKYLNGAIYQADGFLVNSGKFNGLDIEKAKKKITEYVGGEMTKNFRLRDWSISRQRYWGAPIPVVYSPDGEAKYVGDENLPWLLPDDVDFVPTGESPLAKSKELKERTESLFGEGWRPEVDTMDTFVCSSWYFLRYPDAKNDQEFCTEEKLKRWLPVDMYIGGPEHTYMHLLYARFWVKAMHRLGMIDFDEPFKKLRHQGMVLDKNGVKMSKSKGNVVNPNDMVEKFGADATRLYMMFAGPLEDDVMWNEEGVKGVYRFLEKVWRVFNEVELIDCEGDCEGVDKSIPTLYHKTLKKVTEDIENLSLNTAVSQMMIFINEALKQQKLPKPAMKNFLIILNPFAPHITEELWSKLGESDLILDHAWPTWNEKMTKDETIKIAIQVNGKVRDTLEVDAEIDEEEIKKLAQESEKVKKWIEGKEPKKVIYVKGKLVSVVV